MKISNIVSHLPKSPLMLLGGLLTATAISVGAFAAFGPERPTLTWNGDDTQGADYVTFNSFVNHPTWGDERNFARGAVAERDSGWHDPVQNVKQDDTIIVTSYIHNNADASLNASGEGIAEDTTIRFDIPSDLAETHQITGTIRAENAQPEEVFDTLTITTETGFSGLTFVPGSARISGNHIDSALSDDIVAGGVALGDALNGDMEGCFDASVFVTFEVTVDQPRWQVEKTVRASEDAPGNWVESINVERGDSVDWSVKFINAGETELSEVNIIDQLPEGLSLVEDSARLINSNNAAPGTVLVDDSIQNNNTLINSIIGRYLPGAEGVVWFTTIVNGDACGVITNEAFAQPGGFGAVVDTASINTGIACEEETFEYECSALEVRTLNATDRTIETTAVITNSSNVSVKNISVDFGDNTVVNGTDRVLTHTFASEGTYNIEATVDFELNDENKTVNSVECSQIVKFETEVENCEVPGKEHLPVGDPNCKEDPETPETPVSLPKTGAGSAIFTFFGATSAAAAAYGYIQNRRLV